MLVATGVVVQSERRVNDSRYIKLTSMGESRLVTCAQTKPPPPGRKNNDRWPSVLAVSAHTEPVPSSFIT